MAYINNETGEIGTLYKLLPDVSNPILFSEEELAALGITKYVPEVVEKIESLEEAVARKNVEIKAVYVELSNEGFECSNGIKLDCRESDKINWLAASLQQLPEY